VRSRIAIFLLILMCCVPVVAQQPSAAAPAVSAEKLTEELRIPAILKISLSSKKSKIGDLVRLEVAADVRDTKGAVIIPRHARLTGRVTQVIHYEKKAQPAMLSFTVERAEWKDHSSELDAPVYGLDVLATDSTRVEDIGTFKAATLGIENPVNVITTEVQEDTRVGSVGSGYAHAIRDKAFHTWVMQLKRTTDPTTRSAFVKQDGDLHVPSEMLVFLLNGMVAAH
jgi:hypothetical protein